MAGKPIRFSGEQAAQIRLLYEAGAGSSALAAQFGTNPHTIIRTIVRIGGNIRTVGQSRAIVQANSPPRDAEHAALRARNAANMRRIRGIKSSPPAAS